MKKKKYNKKFKVSIIINCYNGENFLKQCIQSVINQTYKNWEIIFWDNLSTDNSKKILKNFKDKRIKYFKTKKFTKLYEARNLAIKKSGGKVTWSLEGKTLTNDIIRKQTIKVGGLRDYKEERIVIKLDVKFAGGYYKEVEFTLDDRDEKSKILFDRETMNRFNVMVNPNRKYIITTKYSLDDKKGEK